MHTLPPSTGSPARIPQAGEIFAEKYRIERVIGVGGMGIVLAATHIHLDQRVAIKMLLPQLAQNEQHVARFLREGRAVIKIRSEHVARVLDVGRPAMGAPYLVMEYLEGTDLAAHLHRHGVLPITVAVDYVMEACEALAEAHAMGTIHRDLKPANLFVAERPDGTRCIKLLDFGISKVMDGVGTGDQSMTKTSTLMGSPIYMSPEQLRSLRSVDTRTDIRALGVILYESIVGNPPFAGDSLPELSVSILTMGAPLLCKLRPEAPAGLELVIAGCLKKDVTKRIPDVGTLANALAPFGSPRAHESLENIRSFLSSAGSVRAAVAASPSQSGANPRAFDVSAVARTEAAWDNAPQKSRATRLAFIAGGVVAALAVLGGLGIAFRPHAKVVTAPPASASTPAVALAMVEGPPAIPSAAPPASPPPSMGGAAVGGPGVDVDAGRAPMKPLPPRPVARPPAAKPSADPSGLTTDRHG